MSGEPVTPAAKRCVICRAEAGCRLDVVPICDEHSAGQVEATLDNYGYEGDRMARQLEDLRAVLARWLKARDAYNADWTGIETGPEHEAAIAALERMARKVVQR